MKAVFMVSSLVLLACATPARWHQRQPARLVLDDGGAVTSDGRGVYADGTDGVEAYIGTPDNAPEGSFSLRFSRSSSRAFKVALTNPFDTVSSPRRGVLVSDASKTSEIFIRDLLSIPIGTTASRAGHIQLEIEYVDGKASRGYELSFNTQRPHPVAAFSVKRVSETEWTVETGTSPDGDVSALGWASLPKEYPHGNGWTFLGTALFHTPVRMTITTNPTP